MWTGMPAEALCHGMHWYIPSLVGRPLFIREEGSVKQLLAYESPAFIGIDTESYALTAP